MMKRKITIGLLLALTILAQTAPVNAQEGQPISPTQTYELTFADLGYVEKRATVDDSESYIIYIPGNAVFTTDQNYVDLLFSHTAADSEFPAGLVVTFNEQLAGVIPLDAENADHSQVRLTFPPTWFKPGYNRLTAALYANVPCGREKDILLTGILHPESILHLEYSQSVQSPDLAAYPLPFTERSFLPETIYFVLPDEPTAMDIATVATIGAGLGRFSGGLVQVASVLDTELTDEIRTSHHLIVVGQMDTNRVLSQLNLPLPLEPSAFAPEYGVIQEIVSPWNPYKMLLVVTGQNAEGVFKAGAALNRETHFLSMKGQVVIVEDLSPAEEVEQTDRLVDMTFDSLDYTDIVLYGSRAQNVDYYFNMPMSWQLKESPSLTLAFQHAATVDPEVSSLDILLNRVPVGGVQLDDSNKINGTLEVELPSWLLQAGRNQLNVQVKMDHPASGGEVCVYLDSEQIWVVIRRDSFIHLAYTAQSLPPDLALFPYPFNINANLNDLVFILPDQLSDEERDGLLRLAVALGAMTGGDQLTLHASTAGELNEALKATSNLLVIGQPSHNTLIRELNNYLPQPFEPNSNVPAPGLDSVVLAPDPNRDVGFIQELVSPWNTERTILIITGITSRGVSAAFKTLLGRGNELRGDLAVIEEDQLYTIDTRPLTSTEEETPVVKATPSSLSSLTEIADNWW